MNTENPLRCPVRLYHLYLSKWCVALFFTCHSLEPEFYHPSVFSFPSVFPAPSRPGSRPTCSTFSQIRLVFLAARCGSLPPRWTAARWRPCWYESSPCKTCIGPKPEVCASRHLVQVMSDEEDSEIHRNTLHQSVQCWCFEFSLFIFNKGKCSEAVWGFLHLVSPCYTRLRPRKRPGQVFHPQL